MEFESKNNDIIFNFMLYFLYQYFSEAGIENFENLFKESKCKFIEKIKVYYDIKTLKYFFQKKVISQSNKNSDYIFKNLVYNDDILEIMKDEASRENNIVIPIFFMFYTSYLFFIFYSSSIV